MLNRQMHFSIESGNFDSGFAVNLQCFDHHHKLILVEQGQLPANPELLERYQKWKALYLRWGKSFRLEPILDEPINISFLELVQQAAKTLEQEMNQWLESRDFAPLRKVLYQELSSTEPTTLFLQTQTLQLQRLPWSCWTLFDEFPQTHFALAPNRYASMALRYPLSPLSHINLLAVLTGGQEVDTEGDLQLLKSLSQTYLEVVRSPTRQEMTDSLWQKHWDILFFAGHSSSDQGKGKFIIAQDQWVSPSEMRFAIQKAAQKGLKLAIFNSCDGLAIAQDLVQNDVPFIITMREPVPDDVAQAFLAYFLKAYAAGQSLFQAFQQAQKRLESMEDCCPCARWLPVLICNPLVSAPDWPHLLGQSHETQRVSPKRRFRPQLGSLVFISMLLLIILGRSLGTMRGAELWAFDQLMQHRPQETQDSRLLIVSIDEAAIQAQDMRTGSIADSSLNQAIEVLSRHQPRVIGLDIYRDHPLDPSLQKTLQTSPKVVGICKSPDVKLDKNGVSAPAGLPLERLGFSDVLEDQDGVVRRQILFMKPAPTKGCATNWSFSSVLALRYLAHEQISHRFSQESVKNQRLILCKQTLEPIQSHWGGYQNMALGGNQIMLNYRAMPDLKNIAEIVPLEDVLQNNIPDKTIRDRVVMIGVTANTSADFWETPYGSTGQDKLPGVFLQAQMVSQLISTVKDLRPLIYTWPTWLDLLWISLWGLIGLGLPQHPGLRRWGLLGLSILGLIFLCFFGILGGLWMPLIPSLIFLVSIGLYPRKGSKYKKVKS